MKFKLYVEGGGEGDLLTQCRKAFSALIERAGMSGRMPRIVACGSRRNAYEMFRTALEGRKDDVVPLLLVDSEAPVESEGKWEHVRRRPDDGWEKPSMANENHLFFMVQCMESWFLADKITLIKYFGQGFLESALPANMNVEELSKDVVLGALEEASRKCKTKSQYSKAQHSFRILERLDPGKIRSASQHAEEFFHRML